MLLFMNVHNEVLYEENAVVTLVLYEAMLLFMNAHSEVLYEDNTTVTLVLYEVMLLFMNACCMKIMLL